MEVTESKSEGLHFFPIHIIHYFFTSRKALNRFSQYKSQDQLTFFSMNDTPDVSE